MPSAREIEKSLNAVARPHRAGSVDGHSKSSLTVLGVIVPDMRAIVRDVMRLKMRDDERLRALVEDGTPIVPDGVFDAPWQIDPEMLVAVNAALHRALERSRRARDAEAKRHADAVRHLRADGFQMIDSLRGIRPFKALSEIPAAVWGPKTVFGSIKPCRESR